MDHQQRPDLEDLDTTMSFVVKVRHKAWIKAQTEQAKRKGDKKASDSKTMREVLDAVIADAEGAAA